MFLLAFETSCDDTSIAIFRDRELLVMKTRSQIREHNETKGVVPEVAARLHANNIFGVLEEVLSEAGLQLEDIDQIACTEFPGLMPSLLVGMSVAKTLSHALKIPYLAIDHIEAHMFANYIGRETEDLVFPSVCLTVSGGHNELYIWKSMFERIKIGETLDDSAGEAFDKVAKMMDLGYPGGPIIGKYASEYQGEFRSIFPMVLLDRNGYDFSFSGLKSAVKREIDKRKELTVMSKSPEKWWNLYENREPEWAVRTSTANKETQIWAKISHFAEISEEDRKEIAFEFEQTVVKILTYKLFLAAKNHNISSVLLAGWVSANDRLRETIENEAKAKGYRFLSPISKVYSMDNAAMIGILAYYRIQASK